MTNDASDREFTAWLLSDMAGTAQALGYTPTRFIRMVNEHGGTEACKRLLRPEIPASIGFCRLHDLGRLDISVESIALTERWGHRFSEDEKATARFRLANADAICADSSLVGE